MISKEEVNPLQKLMPSTTEVHSVAACIISGKISSQRTTENRLSLHAFVVNHADDETIWIKTVL
jgi:hypothetical protein